MTGRLLTARLVAEQLGVSAETVLRWTRRGELPAIRLPGGAIRYREHDLEEWLHRRETGAAPRGVSPTHGAAAHRIVGSLPSGLSPTPPPDSGNNRGGP